MHRIEYTDMGSKTVSIRDDVYRRLKDAKSEDESFSDAIDRLLGSSEGDHPLFDLVGLLDREAAERVRAESRVFRDDVDREMDRYA